MAVPWLMMDLTAPAPAPSEVFSTCDAPLLLEPLLEELLEEDELEELLPEELLEEEELEELLEDEELLLEEEDPAVVL